MVNKNVNFSHFVDRMLFTDHHSVFKGDFKADCILYVTTQGVVHRC